MNVSNDKLKVIDFITLLKAIYPFKWFILSLPVITIIILYYMNTKIITTYEASVSIRPMDEKHALDLLVYSNTINHLQSTDMIQRSIEKVEGYFIMDQERVNIVSNINVPSSFSTIRKFNVTPRTILEKIYGNIPPSIKTRLDLDPNILVDVQGVETLIIYAAVFGEDKNVVEILDKAIDEATRQTSREYLDMINKSIKIYNANKELLLQQINMENQTLISLFKTLSKDRIRYLNEHLQIAKTLGIKDYVYIEKTSEVSPIGSAIRMIPDYLRGFDALEQELVTMKAREDITGFIYEYRLNEELIRMLSIDDTPIILKSLRNIDLFNQHNQLIKYDKDFISLQEFSDKIRFITMIFLCFFSIGIGIIFSLTVFFIRKAI